MDFSKQSVRLGDYRPSLHIAAVILCAILLAGCAPSIRVPYLSTDANIAQIDGFPGARAYADGPPDRLVSPEEWVTKTSGKDVTLLALSGGGSGGAFSVGVLSAWTQVGDRPRFDVVTGVSTGALIAPFAFLGSQYDNRLMELYLGGNPSNLIDINWKTAGIFGSSLLKGQALRKMVEDQINEDVLSKVASEQRKGRRLFVVTTNLDSQRPVTWNLGAIANSGRSDALTLFREVLIASASIPGVFPAVMIKAKAENRIFAEMHSDGGSSMQFFTMPEYALTASGVRLPSAKHFRIFVIINNAVMPEFSNVTNRTFSVMGRAYSTLIKSQTKQGLLALYNFARRSNSELRVAAIDQQVPYSMTDPFNRTYMKTVFERGYSQTLAGKIWREQPVF